MPPTPTPQGASVVQDHVLGDPMVVPSDPTAPRLRRAVLLRRLAADPVSKSSLKTLQLLASLPGSPSQIAAAHIAVAAFLVTSAPDFDTAATKLFGYPNGSVRRVVDDEEGGNPVLASDQVMAAVDQFDAAVGIPFSKDVLTRLWRKRDAEERVRKLLEAEWAAIGPLTAADERIIRDGAVDTRRAGTADEAARVKFRTLAGEENTCEILGKLEEPSSSANPISTPAVEMEIDVLETNCADLHSVVEDPLPATKAVADAARLEKGKGVSLNAEEVRGQPATCGPTGPIAPNDKYKGPSTGKPHSLMDWNPTARTFQWEESPGPESSEPSLRRPHFPCPRRVQVSPFPAGKNKNGHRRPRKKWSVLEEETLRQGVEQYGAGNWKDILNSYPDVFIDRTAVDLKDKWRNMTK